MGHFVHLLAITCLPALALAGCQERSAKPAQKPPQKPAPNAAQHVAQPASKPETPRIKPEETDWQETSLCQDVVAFVDRLKSSKLPGASKLSVRTYGKSSEGRPLILVQASSTPLADEAAVRNSGKLRILVTAGSNGGQVDGKEAVQLLLREIAEGGHADVLEHAVLLVAPVVNPDGNDAVSLTNRPQQNGPNQGVGVPTNGKGIDPNHDALVLASVEARALVDLLCRLDPHVLIDLHTTERAHHGYHLTYSPCMSPNIDKDLDALTRDKLLATVRERMKTKHSYRTFYAGHFLVPDAPLFGWVATEWRPRSFANYYGLRNRIAVRADAYAYRSFPVRVKATLAFVSETLAVAAEQAAKIQALCARADKRVVDTAGNGLELGYETVLGKIFNENVLVGKVAKIEVPELASYRLVANKKAQPVDMPVQASFVAKKHVAIPQAWALPARPSTAVDILRRHGIEVEELTKPAEIDVEAFAVDKLSRTPKTNDHGDVSVEGSFERTRRNLPLGTVIVRGKQRLARLAAQLLEPVSEDSLTTWGVFDSALQSKAGGKLYHPVVRILDTTSLETKKLSP